MSNLPVRDFDPAVIGTILINAGDVPDDFRPVPPAVAHRGPSAPSGGIPSCGGGRSGTGRLLSGQCRPDGRDGRARPLVTAVLMELAVGCLASLAAPHDSAAVHGAVQIQCGAYGLEEDGDVIGGLADRSRFGVAI